MILVTGAGGKTGRAVVAALAARGLPVRAWVRRPQTIDGAAGHYLGDMTNAADWTRAMAGIARVYHICPNMHPGEFRIGRLCIAAAAAAGVSHVVYHSVLHPQTADMPHHWEKLRVEEALLRSNLPFTIVQPTAYMQNLRQQWTAIKETGRLVQPYSPAARISLVDVTDVAEAVASILSGDRFHGATLELAGTVALSQHAVAATAARVLGRPVVAVGQSVDVWAESANALPIGTRERLRAMFAYYDRHGLIGNPAVLGLVLGRRPTSLEAVMRRWR